MRGAWQRLAALFRRQRLERELDDEVRFHLDMLEQQGRARGLGPEAARAAARREFGGVEQVKEEYRERRGWPWIELLSKDVRHAVRALRRSPGFTLAAVVSLALGIGANTAIFTLFYTFMLRMLPVENPRQLVSLYRSGGWGEGFSSYPLYQAFRERGDLFEGVIARSGAWPSRVRAGAGDRPELAAREWVSGNYFQVLGVKPALGRVFTDDDNRVPMAHPLAVVSYDFWRSRLAADPDVLGRVLSVGEQSLTVVGVAAPGFRGIEVEQRTDLWVPLMMANNARNNPGMHWLWIVGRARPRFDRRQLQAAANTVMAAYLDHWYGRHANDAFRRKSMEQRIEVREGGVGISMLRQTFGKPLTLLLAAVGLVLLVACANVAGLMLARGAARRRDTALRFSLGASRMRIARQWMIEGVLLAVLGGALGSLMAFWGARSLLLFLPEGTARDVDVAPDYVVLAFTVGVMCLSVLLFALLPALRATAVDPVAALKEGAEPPARGLRFGFRKALVVGQLAFSLVLAAWAGLFARSLAQLRAVDLGFHNLSVLTFDLDTPRAWTDAQCHALRDRLIERLNALAGVRSASYGGPGPYQRGSGFASIRVPGSPRTASEPVNVAIAQAGPRFFETIGSPPLRGRDIEASDNGAARKVAVVNQAFVREFFSGLGDPLERVFGFDDSKPDGGEPVHIVGVVRDMLHQGVKTSPEPTVYLPSDNSMVHFPPLYLVRSELRPEALIAGIRREVERLAPDAALGEPRTVREQVDESIFLERMTATLSATFAGLALLLAAVGLYGVMAYSVVRRSGEIGIRMALGAARASVLWMVLRDALEMIGAGVAIGLPLSLGVGRLAASLLYGVRPGDPLALSLTVAALLATGIAAALVPAWRAASTEPACALHHE